MEPNATIVVKAAFLKSYLKEKDISDAQFSERIGVANSTLNRIINT